MMIPTEEMRWFLEGSTPSSVTAWFKEYVCADSPQPARVDHYLRLNEGDWLGVKLREGQIEAKQHEGEDLLVRVNDRVTGQVESWRKWSFELADAEAGLEGLAEAPHHWLGVRKTRRMCTFTLGENGRLILVPDTIMLEQGCGFELTEVQLVDTPERWWSLGLEAFGGTANDRREIVRLVAQRLLDHEDAPTLTAAQSYSYPKWLQIVR